MTSTSTRLWAAVAIASAITFTGSSPSALAGVTPTPQHDFSARQMARDTSEARSVGLISAAYGDGDSIVRGSGVLVGGRFVLTAAHLLDDAGFGQFTIRGQSYGMRRWVVASRFYSLDPTTANPATRLFGNGADLALVELDRRVVGARNLKATLNKSRREAGKTATIVGFGRGGDGASGIGPTDINGIKTTPTPLAIDGSMSAGDTAIGTGVWGFQPVKRAGKNIIESNDPFAGDPFTSRRELITDFDPNPSELPSLALLNPPSFDPFSGEFNLDEDDIPISNEFAPSVGDSGGGLFINGRLAGITSWTTRANSEYFSQARYTRISTTWGKWVRNNIAAFNRLRKDPTLVPWVKETNATPGAGFRGVLRIRDSDDVDGDTNTLEVLKIFGPRLFENPDLSVDTNFPLFISNDLGADPGPLFDQTGQVYPGLTIPEPASLALLSLGGLAMLRRTRC
jgi:Trypsin-like peptidase domain